MFKVFFLALVILNISYAGKKTGSECADRLSNSQAFQTVYTKYKDANFVAPDYFKTKEQVWAGECLSVFGEGFERDEAYLVVFRPKTMPRETSVAHYGSVTYNSNPYSNGININTAALAIEWFKGEAGKKITIAKQSEKHNSLRAKYNNKGQYTNLRIDTWAGIPTLFYTLENARGKVTEVCYFNEVLIK